MAKALFNVFFKIIKSVVGIFLAPVNALVVNLFPDLSQLLTTFNAGVEALLGTGLGYFAHLLPPTTRVIILLWLAILLAYYGITVSVHLILKVIHIIKKLKIW